MDRSLLELLHSQRCFEESKSIVFKVGQVIKFLRLDDHFRDRDKGLNILELVISNPQSPRAGRVPSDASIKSKLKLSFCRMESSAQEILPYVSSTRMILHLHELSKTFFLVIAKCIK